LEGSSCKKTSASPRWRVKRFAFFAVLTLTFVIYPLPVKPVLDGIYHSPLRAEEPTTGEEASVAEEPTAGEEASVGKEPTAGEDASVGEETATPESEPAYEYDEPDLAPRKISYTALVLRTIAILAVIVIGIYILFRILVKNKARVIADTDMINVLGTYPLASNRLLQIVEIAGKILILGVTDSSINLIMSVEDKEHADRIKLMSSQESKGGKSFKDQLLNLIGGKAFSRSGQISYLNNYKERIKRMKKL